MSPQARKPAGNGETDRRFAPPTWAARDWPSRLRETRVAGLRTRYVEIGSGPEPVVLIHGLGGSWQTWLENLDALAEDRRVIAIDLPGFGGSESFADATAFSSFADAVRELLTALEIEKASIVGHSMGGLVACDLAARHPDLVQALVLVNAGGIALDRARLAAIVGGFTVFNHVFARPGVGRAFIRRPRLRRLLVWPMVHDARAFSPALAAEMLPLMAAPGFRLALTTGARVANDVDPASIACPVLLLWGTEDRILPVESARLLQLRFADARLVEVSGAGHCPMFEQPQAFNTSLREFLRCRATGQS